MMLKHWVLFAADAAEGESKNAIMVVVVALVALIALVSIIVLMLYGKLWFRAYMSGAHVRMVSLIGMTFRQVTPRVIVEAKIMAVQAGLVAGDTPSGISTDLLEAHYLARGKGRGGRAALGCDR